MKHQKYIILIDRGYIHYSDCVDGVTEFGTTFFKEDAKQFSYTQAYRMAKKIKKDGTKCEVIEIETETKNKKVNYA